MLADSDLHLEICTRSGYTAEVSSAFGVLWAKYLYPDGFSPKSLAALSFLRTLNTANSTAADQSLLFTSHSIMKLFISSCIGATFAYLTLAQAPYYLDITPPKGKTLDAPPRLGLGTWYMRGNTSESIAAAIQLGYRHIDCAKIYGKDCLLCDAVEIVTYGSSGNQREVGAGIALGLKRSGLTRQDIWVTSKLWNSEYFFFSSGRKQL